MSYCCHFTLTSLHQRAIVISAVSCKVQRWIESLHTVQYRTVPLGAREVYAVYDELARNPLQSRSHCILKYSSVHFAVPLGLLLTAVSTFSVSRQHNKAAIASSCCDTPQLVNANRPGINSVIRLQAQSRKDLRSRKFCLPIATIKENDQT